MTRVLTLLALMAQTCFLFSAVEDHLKKITDKTDAHCMRNIDFIYTINLDQRPEKFAQCLKELAPYEIVPYRFSAVNGWELTLETINDVGVKWDPSMTRGHWGTSYLLENEGMPHHEVVENEGRVYFCHCMARGSIGIVLSHMSVLKDALDSGYETIWVMEDDIEIVQNPHLVSDLIEKLDSQVGRDGWDILFTDQDTKSNADGSYVPCTAFAWRPNFTPVDPYRFARRMDISPEFRQIGARYGAYSMIVRRSGMEKIFNFIKEHKIFLPFDMDFPMPEDIKLFTVRNDVVTTMLKAPSDNGGPNYKKSN